jgi:hypothetical protein
MLPKPTAEPVAAKINANRDDQWLCVIKNLFEMERGKVNW